MTTTAADIFRALYQFKGADLDLRCIRIHTESDTVCRTWGARALSIGADIHFRTGEFAPGTREGLWLLAHEVAHVVQQHHGPVNATPVAGSLAVGHCRSPEEAEADAAADAALAGRGFIFARPLAGATAYRRGQSVVQRYMSWEHLILGDVEPRAVREAVREADRATSGQWGNSTRSRQLEARCSLLEELGRDPENVDAERLKAMYPGLETLRLPGSGVVITLGELNILPDYFSRPADIESAPARFIRPLVQSIRTWNLRELRRASGRPPGHPRLKDAMKYPNLGRLAELSEAFEVDRLGRKCGIPDWELYSSVVGRNAAHFAPFSWYRWQASHLMARELIRRASESNAGEERDVLRARARLYAGYADHFLQDSFAAGHLINKTLVMQWYVEWLAGSRLLLADRKQLATMTFSKQPYLHGPGHYHPALDDDGERLVPTRTADAPAVTDPQTAAEVETLQDRILASGVIGADQQQHRVAYAHYLALLGNSVTQLAAAIVHGYFNEHSLMVASRPEGPRYRIWGDHSMFKGEEGAGQAADVARLSRRAIADLLEQGGTDISSREIFEQFPNRVEQDGKLVMLPEWHEMYLRERCFQEFFGLPITRNMRIFLTVARRHLGVPSAPYDFLYAGEHL